MPKKEIAPPVKMPEGLVFDKVGLVYGTRPTHPGLFEIKFHNPRKMNAVSLYNQQRFAELVSQANSDPAI
jgi:hypothetical protein